MGMGKRDEHLDSESLCAPIKLSVRMVRLSGDYEPDGTYWGCHSPGSILYRVSGEPDDVATPGYADFYLRAVDRDHAKSMALKAYPKARFYR
jgi:hypothetical protein